MKTFLTGLAIFLVAALYLGHGDGSERRTPRAPHPHVTPRHYHPPPVSPTWAEIEEVLTELMALGQETPTTLGQLALGFWAWLQTLPFWSAVVFVLLALVLHGLGWLQSVPWVEAKGRKMELKIRIESRQRGLF